MHTINSIALVSNNPKVIETVHSIIEDNEYVTVLSNEIEIERISYEIFDIMIIDYSNWAIAFAALDRVIDDPWFHNLPIITVSNSSESNHQLRSHKEINIIVTLSTQNCKETLNETLALIRCNNQLLTNRHTISYYKNININDSCSIYPSLISIEVFKNLFTNFLFNTYLIDHNHRNRLKIALTELLNNALEHGICEIGFEEKREWLKKGHTISELINKKEFNGKYIDIEYTINPETTTITIDDNGKGFDWNAFIRPNKQIPYTSPNGRGIIMATTSIDDILYNNAGNIVSLRIENLENIATSLPMFISEFSKEIIPPNDIIIKENSPSNYLYFISKGTFDVLVKGEKITTLTPYDILTGEMAFLSNNKRSATVIANELCEVIKISKDDFLRIIKRFPYYALFLARIESYRLTLLNQSKTQLLSY